MLLYSEYFEKDGLKFSCDMIRLDFTFNDFLFNQFQKFVDSFTLIPDCKYHLSYFHCLKTFAYRHLFTFSYSDFSDISFSIGLQFNGLKKSEFQKCFLEFNPNKCLSSVGYSWFKTFFNFFVDNQIKFNLCRYDLAIDIPVNRLQVSLLKDNRTYQLYYGNVIKNGVGDFTEYLGTRNKNGFVKIYNKTIESNLNYNLTRVESTLDSLDYNNFLNVLPNISYLKNDFQFDLKQSDFAVLQLLLQQPQPYLYLSMFGRDKKQKFKDILGSCIKLQLDYCDFVKIKNFIQRIVDKQI